MLTAPRVEAMPLKMFRDRLRFPPVLRPIRVGDGVPDAPRIRMLARRLRLHSQLPPTEVWIYEGRLSGPTIEVRRGSIPARW